MRCAAKVPPRSLGYRSWRSDSDPRCRRQGSVEIETLFGVRSFCYQHAPLYRAHQRIVERILSIGEPTVTRIPIRDMVDQ